VRGLQISPCGRWLATTGRNDQSAMLWRLPDGAPTHSLRHFDRVNSCAFSADGGHVVTAGDDRTARVWDVATGAQLAQIDRPQAVHWAGFLPDPAWLVLRYWDSYAEILAWRPTDLVDIAGRRIARNLSRAEWRAYMEDEPYQQSFPHLPVAMEHPEQ
jgi:WD40 repeat protein